MYKWYIIRFLDKKKTRKIRRRRKNWWLEMSVHNREKKTEYKAAIS